MRSALPSSRLIGVTQFAVFVWTTSCSPLWCTPLNCTFLTLRLVAAFIEAVRGFWLFLVVHSLCGRTGDKTISKKDHGNAD